MPELPEVQSVVTTIRPFLRGRTFERIVHLRPDIVEGIADFRKIVCKRTVADVFRRGKRILISLDRADHFYVHLGMTGHLTVAAPDDPLEPHTHWIALLTSGQQIRFTDARRFGGIFWLGQGAVDDGLGPEPLEVTPAQLFAALSTSQRPIKNALLDQRLLAGVGNIYADEALHKSGIHPLARSGDLDRRAVQKLTRALQSILARAIAEGGSTIRDYRDANGNSGKYQDRHQVYGRETLPCHKCKSPIERIVLAGRSAHFCPNCQQQD